MHYQTQEQEQGHRHPYHSPFKNRPLKDGVQGEPKNSQLTRPTFSFRERFMIGRRKVSKMQSPCKYMDAMHHYLYDDASVRPEALAASHHTGATLIADQIVRRVLKDGKGEEKNYRKQNQHYSAKIEQRDRQKPHIQAPQIPSPYGAITPLNTGKSIADVFHDIFGAPLEENSTSD
jgi:hypothetical protein